MAGVVRKIIKTVKAPAAIGPYRFIIIIQDYLDINLFNPIFFIFNRLFEDIHVIQAIQFDL